MHICMTGAVQAPAEEQQQQLAPPQQGPGLPACDWVDCSLLEQQSTLALGWPGVEMPARLPRMASRQAGRFAVHDAWG